MFKKMEHLFKKMEHLLKAGCWEIVKTLALHRGSFFHLRQLVQEAKLPLQTVSTAVNLLIKTKILQEQRISNLRRFKLNYLHPDCQSLLYSLHRKQIMALPPLVQAALKEFSCSIDQQFILLFGSYAKGIFTVSSDVDIFVYVKTLPKKSPDTLEINRKYGVKISPVFSNQLNTTAQQHILETSIPLTNHMRYYEEYGKIETFGD